MLSIQSCLTLGDSTGRGVCVSTSSNHALLKYTDTGPKPVPSWRLWALPSLSPASLPSEDEHDGVCNLSQRKEERRLGWMTRGFLLELS